MNDATLYTRLREILESAELVPTGTPERLVVAFDAAGPVRGIGDLAALVWELDIRIRAAQAASAKPLN